MNRADSNIRIIFKGTIEMQNSELPPIEVACDGKGCENKVIRYKLLLGKKVYCKRCKSRMRRRDKSKFRICVGCKKLKPVKGHIGDKPFCGNCDNKGSVGTCVGCGDVGKIEIVGNCPKCSKEKGVGKFKLIGRSQSKEPLIRV